MDLKLLRAELVRDEGLRRFAYDDATGKPPVTKGHLTVGIGYNIGLHGLPDDMIEELYLRSVETAVTALDHIYPGWRLLSEERQRGLINMSFNLGETKLAKFTGMWRAIAEGDFFRAAAHVRRSLYARQTGPRAERVAKMLETSRADGE